FWGDAHSEGGWLTLLAYVLLFFATRWLCRDGADAVRLLAFVAAAAAIAATYAVIQAIHADPIAWDETSKMGSYVRPFGTMGHPIFLSAYLVMAVPVMLLLIERSAQHRRWFCVGVFSVGGVLACWTICVALSRGAWLAFP